MNSGAPQILPDSISATRPVEALGATPVIALWPTRVTLYQVSFYLTFVSAVSTLFSIAVSQLSMGLALLTLFGSRQPLRFPPLKLPLALFFAVTVVALFLSPDPIGGLPQIRKFFVFSALLLIASTFESIAQIRTLVLTWGGVATLSALRGLWQYADRRHIALTENANTYGFFLDSRITGFASHWMTFGAVQMIVLLLLVSIVFFSDKRRDTVIAWCCLPFVSVSLVLGLTRSVFLLGVPVGLIFLVWSWRRWAVAAIPIVALLIFTIVPFHVRDRVASVIQPHGDVDSNSRRTVMRRTGWAMVKAHPWFGLGPEQIRPQFDRFVPADIPRPLPRGWYGHLHNIYLQYAAERGVPALVFLLWMLGRAAFDFWVALCRPASGETRFVLHAAIAVILAVLAEGFFEHNLGDSEVLTLLLVVIGCGYVAARRAPHVLF
ncbi:MAG TPA: O-antigen ligase family protein [Bryobacteraceae bacterium]|nr:O-antigen ligase family protein [Bryobacteraceae bacterium]